MKIEITLGIVKSLRLDEKPTGLDAKKTLITETNLDRARYILWDGRAPEGSAGIRREGESPLPNQHQRCNRPMGDTELLVSRQGSERRLELRGNALFTG